MPATGARGRRQFPDGFNHRAQEELMRGAEPVTTRPFLPSSSPLRRSNSTTRRGNRQRRSLGKNPHRNANYYEVLTDDEDGIANAFSAIDLESETHKIISREKERMTIRTDVLRTFAESIATCARKFDHGYAHAVANDFTRSLLHHWNRFLHTGDPAETNSELSQPKFQPINEPGTRSAPKNHNPPTRTVSFADITKAAAHQAPGDVRVARPRRQTVAASNYTDRRILLRLKEGSSFFGKQPYQIRNALNEKLALNVHDIQNISATNTGWSVVASNEEIQKKILESQEQWGPTVDLNVAEKQVTWYKYLIKDFPSELRSYDETILDFNKAISDEIKAQTGQTPVQWRRSSKPCTDPTKTTLIIAFDKPVIGNFRLLELGTYSFLLTKPKRLVQCQNCWLFHSPVRCTATKTCRTCGVADNNHDSEGCQTTPRCTNCHGPHAADEERCYARPKKVGDSFQKLSKSQKIHARRLGANDYRRQNLENLIPSSSSPPAIENETMTTTNTAEVDTEMADTRIDEITAILGQVEHQPPTAEHENVDESMGDTVEELLQNSNKPYNATMEDERGSEVTERMEWPEEQDKANEEDKVADAGEEVTDEDREADDAEEENAEDIDEMEEEAEEERNDNDEDSEEDDTQGDAAADSGCNTRQEEAHRAGNNREGDINGNNTKNNNGQRQPQAHNSNQNATTRAPKTTRPEPTTRGRTAQPMTAVKKRFLTYAARKKIIPSDNTNPSSDGPIGDVILARTSQHSPPSSPPQEARRRDQSPAKRRMTARSLNE